MHHREVEGVEGHVGLYPVKRVGNALIVGDTEDGDFADTKLSADAIMEQIRFFGEDEPLSPPEFRVIGL
jgi:hypothetical protein